MDYFYLNKSLENLSFEDNGVTYLEIWKDIDGYEGHYQISNFGRVKSLGRWGNWRIPTMIMQVSKEKYPQIGLKKNGDLCRKTLHRLVALHFVPNPNNFKIVHHIDTDTKNPFFLNLIWATQSQNCRASYACGNKSQKGEKNNQAKLTQSIVDEIREYYKVNNHLAYKAVGKIFGISGGHTKDIVTYKSWNNG